MSKFVPVIPAEPTPHRRTLYLKIGHAKVWHKSRTDDPFDDPAEVLREAMGDVTTASLQVETLCLIEISDNVATFDAPPARGAAYKEVGIVGNIPLREATPRALEDAHVNVSRLLMLWIESVGNTERLTVLNSFTRNRLHLNSFYLEYARNDYAVWYGICRRVLDSYMTGSNLLNVDTIVSRLQRDMEKLMEENAELRKKERTLHEIKEKIKDL